MNRWVVVFSILAVGGACEGRIGLPTDEGPAAQIGASCREHADCPSGRCLLDQSEPVCSLPCVAADTCPDGWVCGLSEPISTRTGVLSCRPDPRGTDDAPCEASSDCASGLCVGAICVEPCLVCGTDEACVPRRVALADGAVEVAVCEPRLAAPARVLGPVTTSSGTSTMLEVDVPAGTGAMVLVVRDAEAARVAVTRLESPRGTVLLDGTDDEADANPMSPYIETASILVPSSDLVTMTPGSWRFAVGAFDPARFDELAPVDAEVDAIDVIFEPESEVGGALDLHLGLAASFGITATAAASAPFVRAVLDQVETSLLAPAGLSRGVVEISISDPSHDRVEDGDETRALCRTASRPGPNGTSVNLFLVGDLAYTSGHSGGTPGPPGVFETAASCIVAERLRDGRATGILAAHEVGHFLGLRHTTELDGTADPIADTPSCPSRTEIEACPDYRNLMFPRFPLDPGLTLTAGQIAVIRRNPILYE